MSDKPQGSTWTTTAPPAMGAVENAATMYLLKDLAVYYPSDLLLLVQVTKFSCGGFVVGATWNHVAADGARMAQFLQAVGELARGVSPPSVVPVRHWDESLPGLPASMVSMQRPTMDHVTQDDLAHLDVIVPGSLIRRVKAETGGPLAVPHPRGHVAVVPGRQRPGVTRAAHVPVQYVRARRRQGRARLWPAASGTLSGSSGAPRRRLRTYCLSAPAPAVSTATATGGGAAEKLPQPQVGWYDVLAMSSWHNLGFDTVDLDSGGRPARVMQYADRNVVPGCVVCPPCTLGNKDDSTVSMSSVLVKPEHVDAFLGELANLATST
ncbi:acyl transferase 15-like [Miscanthus floridulus]|uniref:acyl transferase 15-like n=1 Tax=Miscanthus floridulus TaxID=154761 RepID=UPI0034597129